ncbi:MAG: 4-hydroxy-3-methylbut-2-enyl diphosphate reductase, partial [Actinobacteria bacterium]|nr:4-hydroxy-3-methylbut-2-enyl diphosphate reductase [Actinomycetota bacterium]
PTEGKKLVWLSQTTLSVDETLDAVAILKERFPQIQDPPSDDICYATQNRQEAIKAIAPQADLVLVVGSTNSSNSVRLVEVAKEYGTPNAYLLDFAAEAKDEWLEGVETIGVTSGASVPEILVNDLLTWLAERGFGDVETVTAMEESLLFSLPPELRKDMKAAEAK